MGGDFPITVKGYKNTKTPVQAFLKFSPDLD